MHEISLLLRDAAIWVNHCGAAVLGGFAIGVFTMYRFSRRTVCHYHDWLSGFRKSETQLVELLKEDRKKHPPVTP